MSLASESMSSKATLKHPYDSGAFKLANRKLPEAVFAFGKSGKVNVQFIT